jgi:hypothetical protein
MNVVQVLIEAGADVFTRNVDARTARHVSRGNLAISKLLRKAEDEWLWYRLNSGFGKDEIFAPGAADPSEDVEDLVEAMARRIEKTGVAMEELQGNLSPAADSPKLLVNRLHRVIDKCQDVHTSKEELLQLQAVNLTLPQAGIEEFMPVFSKLAQQGPKHRLPFLLSKSWSKELVPKLFEDERGHCTLLQPAVVASEDVVRLLISTMPPEKLPLFGKLRNKDKETWLHLLCKGPAKAATLGSRADVLSLLLAACPPETFDFEAIDHRGQTALHLAAQGGDVGLVQVLLEAGANPNAQEETTGWTPLHFAVSKGHYSVMMQIMHHETADVNQVDKFDWPPLFEACSRLDHRSTSLLVNGGALMSFRNQHDFDCLKAVDTSKKDLPAKRWMSCLMISNGFGFEASSVQLSHEDRETFEREQSFFRTRSASSNLPPFHVPDHLAPRCQSCKVLFSVTVRRHHCRSCGVVLCQDCVKTRECAIVPLDECLYGRRPAGRHFAGVADTSSSAEGCVQRGGAKPTPPVQQPGRGVGVKTPAQQQGCTDSAGDSDAESSGDSFEEPPLAEELPPVMGPPESSVGAVSIGCPPDAARAGHIVQGTLVRERGMAIPGSTRTIKLCGQCDAFHEVGVGETYAMLQRRGF